MERAMTFALVPIITVKNSYEISSIVNTRLQSMPPDLHLI